MSLVRAIALDLDATIAAQDVVSTEVAQAIAEARLRGLRLLLVTGRTLSSLKVHFPGLIDDIDAVVAAKGSVLVGSDRHRLLAERVNRCLADSLERRGMGIRRSAASPGHRTRSTPRPPRKCAPGRGFQRLSRLRSRTPTATTVAVRRASI
jgi:hypothetical protein